VVTERARDHRDVFVTHSDDGTTWSTPSRVNDDPGFLDNWLPEIAVASLNRPYVIWYDWRDAPPCGAASHVYAAHSADGGDSWTGDGPVTDVQSAWTSVASNIAPNQGSYIALAGTVDGIYPAWADGRNGDPDIYFAPPIIPDPVQVSLASVEASPGHVRIVWALGDGAGLAATVQRQADAGEWEALGQFYADGSGRIAFEDRDVTAGVRYHYRLGLRDGGAEVFAGEVTVDVPSGAVSVLAIQGVRPNPADREMLVSFSLAGSEPARLELLDVSGRRVREQVVTAGGVATIDLAAGSRLAPGVYVVRLTQSGRSMVKRVSVVR
jgi:hypothetical protein